MSDYKINKDQKAYLNSLICQRLSEDEANRKCVKDFIDYVKSQDPIDNYLPFALDSGWNQDKKDKVAFYMIKDAAGEPLLFFSLKCGEMHKPLIPEKLNNAVQSALMLLKVAASDNRPIVFLRGSSFMEQMRIWKTSMEIMQLARSVEVEPWAEEVIEKQLVDGELPEAVWEKLWMRASRSMNRKIRYDTEVAQDGENIIRTKQTFAAVEMVHFCVHEPARDKWKAMGMGRSMGRTLFWYFIEPIIQEIRELVGCEYIYLFAADDKGRRDGTLIKYYQEMGFDFCDDVYVTKPQYDFLCYFMCQKVTPLRNRQKEFFREYNKPKEPRKN